MAGSSQLGLTVSALMMEHITSLWKVFKKTLKTHNNQRREWLPQSSQSVLTDVQNHQLYLGFSFTLATGQSHKEQLAIRSDVCEMESCHTASLQCARLNVLLQCLERMLSLSL